MGRENSVQKENRLYNKHLSEEIKTHLIEISDDYYIMKNWLICNYGSPSRIVRDIVSSIIANLEQTIGRRSLFTTQLLLEPYKD